MSDRDRVPVFEETQDVARATGLAPVTIRELAETGKLRVAARTRRGGRLFAREDVVALVRERESRPK